MKKVMGGAVQPSHNENCGPTNPYGDYTCCTWDGAYYVGPMDCDSASLECAGLGGHGITTDPSRCNW